MNAQSIYEQIIELTDLIGKLKTRAEVAEVQAQGANNRAQLLLESKDLWMARALKAEGDLKNV